MTQRATPSYRRGALLVGLLLALLALVCIVAATQPDTRSLLVSSMGGPITLSVGVTLLVLVAGLFSVRAVSGGARQSDLDSVSLLRETALPDAYEEPAPTAAPAPTPTIEEQREPIKPRPARREAAPVLKQLPVQWTDESGENQTKLADVLNYSDNDFSLIVGGALSKGQAVWIADDDVLRRGVIKFAEEGSGPRRIDVHLLARERRGSERTEGAGKAHVLWSDNRRGEQKTMVTIRNFSAEGFQVFSSKPVQPGHSVLLKGETLHSAAKVLYCTEDAEGYLLGMKFLTNSDLTAPKPQWTASTELEMDTSTETEEERSDAE